MHFFESLKGIGCGPRTFVTGADGKEGEEDAVFVYRGDVANRAIQLAGFELSMFKDKLEIKRSFEFEKMSDAELVQELEREARLLLENHSGGSDAGNGDSCA